MTDHRRGEFYLPLLSVLLDAAAIEAAFLFAYWLRFETPFFADFGFVDATKPAFASYLEGSAVVVLVWLLLFQSRGMYAIRRNVTLADELFGVIKVVSLGMLLVMSAAFFYRDFSYSRIVFGLLWAGAILLIFSGRAALRTVERWLYR